MSGSVSRSSAGGRSLCERQPDPVEWAGRVVGAAALTMGRPPEIEAALALAEQPDHWPQARLVFDRLRRRSLEEDKPLASEEELFFRLAELVAKLAHNSSGQRPPFDHDSGWRVGPLAYRLAVEMADSSLCDRLAVALGGWPDEV